MDYLNLYRQPTRLYILILNVFSMLVSIGLLAMGIFGLASDTRVLFESDTLSWSLIALSLIILVVSVMGCVGALGDSKRVLSTYGVLLSLLVVFQFVLLIYAMARHDQVDRLMDSAWQKAYDTNPRTLQDLETRLQCCGYADVTDRAIPKDSKRACLNSPAFGYQISCRQQLQDSYYRNERAVMGISTVLLILQILALVSGVVLWTKLPRDDQVEYRYRSEHSERLLRGMRDEDEAMEGNLAGGDESAGGNTGGGGGRGYGATNDIR